MDTLCKFEHQGRTLRISAVEEERPIAAAPGLDSVGGLSGDVQLGPITLSASTIAPGDTVALSARVGGQDITFVYLELLLRNPQTGQYYGPVYREAIAAPRMQTIGGVDVPDWREPLVAQVTVQPFLRLLTDGKEWSLGFVRPPAPKTPDAAKIYTLEALYRSAWGRKQHRAQVSFDSTGEGQSLLVFRDTEGGAMPRAANPRRGDRFTPLLQVYRPAGEEGVAQESAIVQGDTLKWRGEGLRWQAEPLLPGTYLAGLVAEDLDGQLHRRYAELVVGSR